MCSKNIYYIQRKKGITQARGIRSETSKAADLYQQKEDTLQTKTVLE